MLQAEGTFRSASSCPLTPSVSFKPKSAMSSSRAADVINSLQLALARTPSDLEQRHQAFIHLYNTTAHQGLLADQRLPPIPVEVLGTAQGRLYAPEVLAEKFAHAFFPRITNRYGCVTLHSYHF